MPSLGSPPKSCGYSNGNTSAFEVPQSSNRYSKNYYNAKTMSLNIIIHVKRQLRKGGFGLVPILF